MSDRISRIATRPASTRSSPTSCNATTPTTERVEVAAIADAYGTLSDRGRDRFLVMLATDFWTDPAGIERAIEARGAARGDAARRGAERALRAALTPPAAPACSGCSPVSTTA